MSESAGRWSGDDSVTVAVVSWNTKDLLERCLTSLDSTGGRVDVCVVDNDSADGSADMVREKFPAVELIAMDRNLGFGPAVNLAAERSNSTWIAPCNADISLRDGAIDSLLKAGDRHRGAGVIAPRLLLPDGSSQHSVYRFPTLGFTLLFNLGAYRVHSSLGDRLCLEGHWDPDQAREVDWAIGAFYLVRREAWEAVGGFSEEQWMYAEDLDLGWRLRKAGWTTWYEPSAAVLHEGAASTSKAWGEEKTMQWMRSTYAWMLRVRGGFITRATALVNLIGAAVRWAALVPLARVRPSRWARRRDAMHTWMRAHAIGLERSARLRSHR